MEIKENYMIGTIKEGCNVSITLGKTVDNPYDDQGISWTGSKYTAKGDHYTIKKCDDMVMMSIDKDNFTEAITSRSFICDLTNICTRVQVIEILTCLLGRMKELIK